MNIVKIFAIQYVHLLEGCRIQISKNLVLSDNELIGESGSRIFQPMFNVLIEAANTRKIKSRLRHVITPKNNCCRTVFFFY